MQSNPVYALSGSWTSGTLLPGHTITADPGTWIPAYDVTFTYQWTLCNGSGGDCVVQTDTKSTFAVTSADVGDEIGVTITGTNPDGSVTQSTPLTPSIP